jgi:hypothetical protein
MRPRRVLASQLHPEWPIECGYLIDAWTAYNGNLLKVVHILFTGHVVQKNLPDENEPVFWLALVFFSG